MTDSQIDILMISGKQELARIVIEERAHHRKVRNDLDKAVAALRTLVGCLEIASVMPEAIGKVYVPRMDSPELEAARAALANATPPASTLTDETTAKTSITE